MGTKFQGTEEEVNSLNTFICLMRAAHSIGQRISSTFIENNLTISQFGILEALFHLGPMCQKALSDKILKSTANITTVLDNLEKRELVVRIRNLDDKRYITVQLTDKGRELIQEIFPSHAKKISEELSILSCDEKKVFQKLCKSVGKKVKF